MHRLYDAKGLRNTLDFILKTCTQEEIDAFYKVLDSYTKLLLEQKEA